jgi:hypothetical protein
VVLLGSNKAESAKLAVLNIQVHKSHTSKRSIFSAQFIRKEAKCAKIKREMKVAIEFHEYFPTPWLL